MLSRCESGNIEVGALSLASSTVTMASKLSSPRSFYRVFGGMVTVPLVLSNRESSVALSGFTVTQVGVNNST